MTTASEAIGDAKFVSFTTFRKSGEAVSTPVWIAREGSQLLVTTPDGTGKLKRLKNNPRVEIRPSSRMGKVADDAPLVTGTATAEPEQQAETALFARKYRFEYRLFMFIESRGKAGKKPRVIIRIDPS